MSNRKPYLNNKCPSAPGGFTIYSISSRQLRDISVSWVFGGLPLVASTGGASACESSRPRGIEAEKLWGKLPLYRTAPQPHMQTLTSPKLPTLHYTFPSIHHSHIPNCSLPPCHCLHFCSLLALLHSSHPPERDSIPSHILTSACIPFHL